MLDDPVDRRDDLADVHPTVRDADLHRHDPGVRGHPAIGRSRRIRVRRREGGVPAGDEPGHERPVAVGVQVAQVGRLGLEREVGSVDDLARRGQAFHPADTRVDDRHVDAVAGEACVPQRRRARIGGRVGHRVHVGSGVVAAGQRGRRDDGRGQQDSGQGAAESTGARDVKAPAAVGGRSVRGDGSALVRFHLRHRFHLLDRSMCGAWQPGGLPKQWLPGEIPGFASPSFDGFAEFADRLGDNRGGCRFLCRRCMTAGTRPMGEKSCLVRGGTGTRGPEPTFSWPRRLDPGGGAALPPGCLDHRRGWSP